MVHRFKVHAFLLLVAFAAPAVAHDVDIAPSVVVDTDMGIDDAATLAVALQCPQLRLAACIASEGVLDRKSAAVALGRMLDEFNRGDVALYEGFPAGATSKPPPFRPFAGKVVSAASGNGKAVSTHEFTPRCYNDSRGGRTLVLALGPLTSLAGAVEDPAVARGIERVLIQGPPDPQSNWNIQFDPAAFDALVRSGVALEFITAGPAADKPPEWRQPGHAFGARTTIGEAFLSRLLSTDQVRAHYTDGVFRTFTDELVLLYAIDHDLFERRGQDGGPACYQVKDHDKLVALFTRLVSDGRAVKDRVVFRPVDVPDDILMPDVRMRKQDIIARNGEAEWFAQLLMNELHEHLGSYSIIGVKMGLRAAELLNAPQHGMQVVSHSAARPPVSCLNDGIIVATGATPGRALFRHEPGEPASTRVSFSYNGRTITLQLKDEYRGKIATAISGLLKEHSLEDARYWSGVRRMSLDIWRDWHRRDLFDVVSASAVTDSQPGR